MFNPFVTASEVKWYSTFDKQMKKMSIRHDIGLFVFWRQVAATVIFLILALINAAISPAFAENIALSWFFVALYMLLMLASALSAFKLLVMMTQGRQRFRERIGVLPLYQKDEAPAEEFQATE